MSFELRERDIYIGRVSGLNDISLNDPSISRQHAHIKRREEGFTIYDMKSLNGVILNGARVSRAILKSGDRIRLGDFEILFYLDGDLPKDALFEIEASEVTQPQHSTAGSDPLTEETAPIPIRKAETES